MAIAYVALGSNLGDRTAFLDRALAALRAVPDIEVRAVSRVRETEPVGGPAQGPFLNAAAEIETSRTARDLLRCLQGIESDLGRRPGPRWGPREIDLDLLLYGDLVESGDGLEVPHPRMAERGFVLEPLAEIAPDVVHPVLQRTIRDLWDDLTGRGREDPSCT